jgi:hypothetical protein
VLAADAVERAHHAALNQAENSFNRV